MSEQTPDRQSRRSGSEAADKDTRPNSRRVGSARKKPVACRRCHARKIKCDGESPCGGCVKSGTREQCAYVSRNRKVKVTERYLEQILAENEQLKASASAHGSPVVSSSRDAEESTTTNPGDGETVVSNPLMQDRAWFVPYSSAAPPIYIGEAACTAFATRFRQSLAISQGSVPHVPRTQYVQDQSLSSLLPSRVLWPSRAQAELLLKIALVAINRSFHVVLPKATLLKLDRAYKNSVSTDPVTISKFFALFALGEAYSSRVVASTNGSFPGLHYYMHSVSLLDILPERANLEHIETLILLSFYSHNLNRRNSAYSWIGTALRFSMNLGLHHNLPQTATIDPAEREHRIRLWWTIYICDKMWGSKMGLSATVNDSNISVDLPSSRFLSTKDHEEFSDADYIIANIKLARFANNIISNIYCRGRPPPFIQSVQTILRDLKAWMATLPEQLRLSAASDSNPRHIITLHLSFNQCVILATRPVLLHVFIKSRTQEPREDPPPENDLTPMTSTLAEACLHAARHSSELLAQVFIEGQLAIFGYFDAQYLFSSAVILAISGTSDSSSKDNERVESSANLLQLMADSGNLSATEFSEHLSLVRKAITEYRSATGINGAVGVENPEVLLDMVLDSTLTTEMALLEQPMQDFLRQAEFEFEFPNPVEFLQDSSMMYNWQHETRSP